jgi:hypothetical protein
MYTRTWYYVCMGRLNGTGILDFTAFILVYHNYKFHMVGVLESLGARK